MHRPLLFRVALSLLAATSFACKPSSPATEPSSEAPPADPVPTTTTAERPSLSEAECTQQGGVVVGDIGDGAIHRPDYTCESGSPPLGTIVAEPGGPMGIEGSVCCPA